MVLAASGSVENLTVNSGTTASLNGRVLGDLINNGTIVLGGDLDGDGTFGVADIDLLYAQIPGTVPPVNPQFDFVPDGVIDQQDVNYLVHQIMGNEFGDADLDGDIDISDFNALMSHLDPQAQNAANGWAKGNFDGDDDVDIRDFTQLVRTFAPLGYNVLASSTAAASSVSPLQEGNALTASPMSAAAVDEAMTKRPITAEDRVPFEVANREYPGKQFTTEHSDDTRTQTHSSQNGRQKEQITSYPRTSFHDVILEEVWSTSRRGNAESSPTQNDEAEISRLDRIFRKKESLRKTPTSSLVDWK